MPTKSQRLIGWREKCELKIGMGRAALYLVRMLERPAIDTVVGRVQAALGEPGDVPVLEAA